MDRASLCVGGHSAFQGDKCIPVAAHGILEEDCLVLDDLCSFLFLVQLFDASSFGEIFDSVSTLCCER